MRIIMAHAHKHEHPAKKHNNNVPAAPFQFSLREQFRDKQHHQFPSFASLSHGTFLLVFYSLIKIMCTRMENTPLQKQYYGAQIECSRCPNFQMNPWLFNSTAARCLTEGGGEGGGGDGGHVFTCRAHCLFHESYCGFFYFVFLGRKLTNYDIPRPPISVSLSPGFTPHCCASPLHSSGGTLMTDDQVFFS